MMLITKEGKKLFINDGSIESFKNSLNDKIVEYQKLSEQREFTKEEIDDVNECMDLYNQIVENEREEGFSPRM